MGQALKADIGSSYQLDISFLSPVKTLDNSLRKVPDVDHIVSAICDKRKLTPVEIQYGAAEPGGSLIGRPDN